MIFISLPLYTHTQFQGYDYGGASFGGTTTATRIPQPAPPTEFLLVNIAHIGALNSMNAQPDSSYVMIGNMNWQIAMTKERVIEEIRAAINASGLPAETLQVRPYVDAMTAGETLT